MSWLSDFKWDVEKILWYNNRWGITVYQGHEQNSICVYHNRKTNSIKIRAGIHWDVYTDQKSLFSASTQGHIKPPLYVLKKAEFFYKMRRML